MTIADMISRVARFQREGRYSLNGLLQSDVSERTARAWDIIAREFGTTTSRFPCYFKPGRYDVVLNDPDRFVR